MPKPRPLPDPILTHLIPADLLAVVLYGEARGEPVEGQIAVACSVQNRLLAGRFGATWPEVMLRWAQYSCLWPTLGGNNTQTTLDFARTLREGRANVGRVARQLIWIADGIIDDAVLDNTEGATHYYAKSIAPPYWTRPPARRTVEQGRHLFFSNVI